MNKEEIKAELRRFGIRDEFCGGMCDDAFVSAQRYVCYENDEFLIDGGIATCIFFLIVAEAIE